MPDYEKLFRTDDPVLGYHVRPNAIAQGNVPPYLAVEAVVGAIMHSTTAAAHIHSGMRRLVREGPDTTTTAFTVPQHSDVRGLRLAAAMGWEAALGGLLEIADVANATELERRVGALIIPHA